MNLNNENATFCTWDRITPCNSTGWGTKQLESSFTEKQPSVLVDGKLNTSQQHILIAKKAFMHWAVLIELQPTGVRKWLFRPLWESFTAVLCPVLGSAEQDTETGSLRTGWMRRGWKNWPCSVLWEEDWRGMGDLSSSTTEWHYTQKRETEVPQEKMSSNKMQYQNFQLAIRKKEIITVRVATHWNRSPVRPLGGSSSSQVFKTSLDKALSHLIELALL